MTAKMHASTQIEGHSLITLQHWDDDDAYTPSCECGASADKRMTSRQCDIWHLEHRREMWGRLFGAPVTFKFRVDAPAQRIDILYGTANISKRS